MEGYVFFLHKGLLVTLMTVCHLLVIGGYVFGNVRFRHVDWKDLELAHRTRVLMQYAWPMILQQGFALWFLGSSANDGMFWLMTTMVGMAVIYLPLVFRPMNDMWGFEPFGWIERLLLINVNFIISAVPMAFRFPNLFSSAGIGTYLLATCLSVVWAYISPARDPHGDEDEA